MARRSSPQVEHVTVHGHRRTYVRAGSGPVVLLLHGLGCDHTTWAPVIDSLSRTHTVIAPDLLGHGSSDKPRADYSVGGYANGMRDLLTVLGIDTATVVGHSFGGGVAITTPGFHQVMGLLAAPGIRHAATTTMRVLARSGISQLRDLDEVAAIYDSFKDPRARAAIRHVVRAVVDWKGQIVSMADRAYLTEAMPMCVIWGADDLVIPVSHASNASALAPTARVEIIPNAGHFPHRDHPERFAKIVRDFIRSTEPARYDRDRWRDLLDEGAPVRPAEARAGDGPLDPLDDVRHATPA